MVSDSGGPGDKVRPLVDRPIEQAALETAMEHALHGHGSTILLCGLPGVGKTHLVAGAQRLAADRGFRVLAGVEHETSGISSLRAWQSMMRELDRSGSEGVYAQAIQALEEAPASANSLDATPDQSLPFATMAAVSEALASAARRTPLLCILDDYQWDGLSSRNLLRFLARELRFSSVVIVATTRGDPLTPSMQLSSVFSDLSPVADVLVLRPLSSSAATQWLVEQVGDRLPPELLEIAADATGGLPGLLMEAVRTIREVPAAEALPSSIDDWEPARRCFARRIALFTARELEPLKLAAIGGMEIDFGVLSRALRVDIASIQDDLRSAQASGIVEEAEDGRWRFRREFFRTLLVDSLSNRDRENGHLLLARAMVTVASRTDLHRILEIAEHYFAAGPMGDAAATLEWADRVAELARAAGKPAISVVWLRRSLEICRWGGAIQSPGRTAVLLARLSSALHLVGSGREGDALATEALRMAIEARDANALGAVALIGGFVAPRLPGDAKVPLLLAAALADWLDGTTQPGARALARWAMEVSTLHHEPAGQRLALANRAATQAELVGDAAALALSLVARRATRASIADPDLVASDAPRIIEIGRDLSDWAIESAGLSWSVFDALESGQIASIEPIMARLSYLRESFGRVDTRYVPLLWRMSLSIATGNFDLAEPFVAELSAVAPLAETVPVPFLSLALVAQLRWHQGRIHELLPLLEQLPAASQQLPGLRPWLAWIRAAAGDVRGAERTFNDLAALDLRGVAHGFGWTYPACLTARVCVRLGRRTEAERILAMLEPFRTRWATFLPALLIHGPVELEIGLLLGALGRPAQAADHLRRAVHDSRRAGCRPALAEALIELARIRVREDARAAAGDPSEEIAEASSLVSSCNLGRLRPLLAEVEGSLERYRSIRGSTKSERVRSRTDPAAGLAGQFRREGMSWVIGLSDRESRFPSLKGLGYLHHLLLNPGIEVHVVELSSIDLVPLQEDGSAAIEVRRASEVSELRARLATLRTRLDHFEATGNREAMASTRDEVESCAISLAKRLGLTGSTGNTRIESERTRVNVQRSIRLAIERIEEHDPDLAQHLSRCIETGSFCRYMPDALIPVDWRL